MATINSNGTGGGNWSNALSWSGGVVPSSSDDVFILDGDEIIVDTMGCNANNLKVDGIISNDSSTSAELIIQRLFELERDASMLFDVSDDYTKTFTFQLNGSSQMNGNKSFDVKNQSQEILWKGYSRKRWTRLVETIDIGATEATLSDITNWKVGDEIAFETTGNGGANYNERENKIITDISGNIVQWSGGTTYKYISDCPVSNITSNMIVKSFDETQQSNALYMYLDIKQEPITKPKYFSNVRFEGLGYTWKGGLHIYTRYWQSDSFKGIDDCIFYNSWAHSIYFEAGNASFPMRGNSFYKNKTHSTESYNSHIRMVGVNKKVVEDCFFSTTTTSRNYFNAKSGNFLFNFNRCHFSGSFQVSSSSVVKNSVFADITFAGDGVDFLVENCDINISYGYERTKPSLDIRNNCKIIIKDCNIPESTFISNTFIGGLSIIGAPDDSYVKLANKNKNPLIQETYTNISNETPTSQRDNQVYFGNNGSSIKINVGEKERTYSERFQIFAPSGGISAISGYIKRSSDEIGVKVILSGLGITPVEYECNGGLGDVSSLWNGGLTTDSYDQVNLATTQITGANGILDVEVIVESGIQGQVHIDGFSAPASQPINTGDFGLWYNGSVVPTVLSNFVSPADVWNTKKSELTLPGSIGENLKSIKGAEDRDLTEIFNNVPEINNTEEDFHNALDSYTNKSEWRGVGGGIIKSSNIDKKSLKEISDSIEKMIGKTEEQIIKEIENTKKKVDEKSAQSNELNSILNDKVSSNIKISENNIINTITGKISEIEPDDLNDIIEADNKIKKIFQSDEEFISELIGEDPLDGLFKK